ncbi:MAG: MazG-like family protein [Finegoldia magna]|nr:MazG-like family protein [Finegoldia magna]
MIYRVLKPELFVADTKLLRKYDLLEDKIMNPTHICHSKTFGSKEDIYYCADNKFWCGFNVENHELRIECRSFGGKRRFEFDRSDLENSDLSKIDRECIEYTFNFIHDLKENGVIYEVERVGKRSFEDLKELTLEWANSKDLLHSENAEKQFMKFIEEVFEFKFEMETHKNYLKACDSLKINGNFIKEKSKNDMKLEMGDIFVTLIVLCKQLGIDCVECLEMAYEKISKRKGKTIDGIFIKEEDL